MGRVLSATCTPPSALHAAVPSSTAPSVDNNDGQLLLHRAQARNNRVGAALDRQHNVGNGKLHVKLALGHVAADDTLNVGAQCNLQGCEPGCL